MTAPAGLCIWFRGEKGQERCLRVGLPESPWGPGQGQACSSL